MKKHLLASTALAAVGALALSGAAVAQDKKMKPSLTVGGAWEANVGVGDNDVDGQDGIGVQQDVEVHFKGKAALDNGITLSTVVELEGNTEADTIDETKVFISGDFGQIQIGALDEAGYEMTFGYHGSVSTGTGNQTLEFDVGDWIPNSIKGLAAHSGRVNISSDSDTVAYYTPRFNGFQMGVSYSRTNSGDGEDGKPLPSQNFDPAMYEISHKDDPATPKNEEGAPVLGKDTHKVNDIVAAAINYNQKHGDTTIGAAFGYVTGDSTHAMNDDPENWGGGLWVDFSGVKVGVGYVRHNEVAKAGGDEVDRWDIGGRYSWGPNAVSLGYIHVEKQTKETAAGRLSYSRSLGPGVTWSLDALWAEYEAGSESQDGTAYTTGIKVAF